MTSVPPPFRHPGPPPLRPELPDGAPEPPAVREDRLGVPWWASLVAMLAAFAGVLVVSLIVGIAVGIGGGDVEDFTGAPGVTIGLTVVQDGLLIAAAWFTAQLLSGRRPSPAAFGLRLPDPGPAIAWTIGIYLGFWVVAIVVLAVLGEPAEQDLVRDLKEEDALPVLIGFGVLTCVVAPLTEEFFFRGFMFRSLHERMPLVWAVVITAAIFGIIHLPGADPLGVLVLTLLGVALCLVLWRTGSLIPCIMLHAFHNSMSFGLTKELPWWGFLLLIAGSVTTTLAISLPAVRLGRSRAPA